MILYRTPWFELVFRRGRFIVEERNSRSGAVIVPKVGDDYLLVELDRPAIDARSLEFPRGYADKGETAEQCAARELFEETGVSVAVEQLQLLGKVAPNTGLLDSIVNVYSAPIFDSVTGPEDAEVTRVHQMSDNELRAAIKAGRIIDGFTLSALALIDAN
jgi:ADP-ribose pyrophosphatase